eukprot:GHVN01016867.1.p1 GENE.GHVN01016867.1~~GHVN01016867.1.p1  ORF type:complete len:436 (+),score=95.90 GHVN01016867.1:101-1408(+)
MATASDSPQSSTPTDTTKPPSKRPRPEEQSVVSQQNVGGSGEMSEVGGSGEMSEVSDSRPRMCRSGTSEMAGDPDLDNLRIKKVKAVNYPQLLMEEMGMPPSVKETVMNARRGASEIINQSSQRLLVVVGPCSIHDQDAAIEYATRLKTEATRLSSNLLIMMRVYFEKPRTTVGWKGYINDPNLDETYDINKGLKLARQLLVDISLLGVPCASEFLDVILPQYMADVIAWAAVGARTTESQLHRELASGLSMPVGFKNGTSGDIQVAVDAIRAANHPHSFISITKQGLPAIVHSMGNKDCHIVLRGGKTGPNYKKDEIDKTREMLTNNGALPSIMVDVSHGNSEKKFKNQLIVIDDVCKQLRSGDRTITGVMIESHLNQGNQSIPKMEPGADVRKTLKYGVSVTDACISWEDTVDVLNKLNLAVEARKASQQSSS